MPEELSRLKELHLERLRRRDRLPFMLTRQPDHHALETLHVHWYVLLLWKVVHRHRGRHTHLGPHREIGHPPPLTTAALSRQPRITPPRHVPNINSPNPYKPISRSTGPTHHV
eukprot:CAMPEP_0184681974 /NCGR_PEP_ID=MMETSP0312-20130426/5141_1 /TAXON_ID=31354 /ORGANISM="Compsopogon coeruleus, Strain SAG 36.94" /LENGTH=112 /DNA_ID=CAMNT_0027133163 /DNA_START=261 /DNA_END=596 /DNA_ORIENTATION=+